MQPLAPMSSGVHRSGVRRAMDIDTHGISNWYLASNPTNSIERQSCMMQWEHQIKEFQGRWPPRILKSRHATARGLIRHWPTASILQREEAVALDIQWIYGNQHPMENSIKRQLWVDPRSHPIKEFNRKWPRAYAYVHTPLVAGLDMREMVKLHSLNK